MRRRDFLGMPVALGGLAAMSSTGITDSMAMAAQPRAAGANPLGVKALVFDTFGTVVDWRGSIIREATQWGQAKNLQIDWGKFADQWRAGYGPSMDKVRKGTLPWMKLDDLHRMILDDLLKQYNITGLSEEEKGALEYRVASAERVAGCGGGIDATKEEFRDCDAIEWQRFSTRGDGKIRGAAVGHGVRFGSLSPLQA